MHTIGWATRSTIPLPYRAKTTPDSTLPTPAITGTSNRTIASVPSLR